MWRCIATIRLQVRTHNKILILAASSAAADKFHRYWPGAIPLAEKAEFIRNQYLHLNWYNRDGHKLTDGLHPYTQITDLETYCEIEVNRAGTFHFYFTYEKRYLAICFDSPSVAG